MQLRDLATAAANLAVGGDAEAAAATLTPVGGFFFGSTDIDEWYIEDMKSTAAMVERALRAAKPGMQFIYHSSW